MERPRLCSVWGDAEAGAGEEGGARAEARAWLESGWGGGCVEGCSYVCMFFLGVCVCVGLCSRRTDRRYLNDGIEPTTEKKQIRQQKSETFIMSSQFFLIYLLSSCYWNPIRTEKNKRDDEMGPNAPTFFSEHPLTPRRKRDCPGIRETEIGAPCAPLHAPHAPTPSNSGPIGSWRRRRRRGRGSRSPPLHQGASREVAQGGAWIPPRRNGG